MIDRAQVLGCPIDRLDLSATLSAIEETIASRRYTQHMAINAAKLVAMRDDPKLGQIIDACGLVNADGQSVVWASRLLGDPLPERVAGIDLMEALLGLSEQRGYRVYILGARADVLARAIERLRERFPRLALAGARDGYFGDGEAGEVCAAIRTSRPDILFVAMSSPRKEYFLGEHGPDLGAPFVMGVGGSIDVIAGLTRRAPVAWQRLGLEWLFRLLQEPRRMFRRYAVTNARFLALVGRAMLEPSSGLAPAVPPPAVPVTTLERVNDVHSRRAA
jgi:N-acetylglucosaminyldiphosphoundecaprenol N-acetyl-beta-D-mannosaminyltransferase